ncbi:MAG TPA: glycosyl hydrolase family 39 [Hanamia sp.]
MKKNFYAANRNLLLLFTLLILSARLRAQKNTVTINWDKTATVSKTTPTLQVVVNPMLERGSSMHDGTFEALKNLGADYVRFVPWFPYPHMAVAELNAPTKNKTFWDFSQVDPIVEDFMKAQEGHSVVMNFSTIPAWLFKTDKPVDYPSSPDSVFWSYNQGNEFRDTTLKELTGYYERLFSWYTKGGFTDELGAFHKSGHFYDFPYWEVLNEVDFEHFGNVQAYTKVYDVIVTALKKISPQTKFIGLALAFESNPEWFEYFLNPLNHAPGVPLEGISYHFYGTPDFPAQTLDCYQYSFFNKADAFLDRVRYIENIRKRLAPQTFTTIDEIGNILGDQSGTSIPDAYWNLSGAMYAYIYVELSKIGIDIAGESQLVGYPSQYPDVTMIDWKDAKPNARYWVLKLLKDNFGPGDKLVNTDVNSSEVVAQGFLTTKGKKLLLINKRNKDIQITLPAGIKDAEMFLVDGDSNENPPTQDHVTDTSITLKPFSVSVIEIKN